MVAEAVTVETDVEEAGEAEASTNLSFSTTK
jgi:hypothetical protein